MGLRIASRGRSISSAPNHSTLALRPHFYSIGSVPVPVWNTKPYSRFVWLLVLWYGVYQALHIAVNVRGVWRMLQHRSLDFPAPPPPGGWSLQTQHFFIGMAFTDLVGSLLALLFVIGYLRHTRWWLGLGTVVLTISLYAALVFNYGTWAAGAWTSSGLWVYTVVNLTFLPVLVLAALIYRWCLSSLGPAGIRV